MVDRFDHDPPPTDADPAPNASERIHHLANRSSRRPSFDVLLPAEARKLRNRKSLPDLPEDDQPDTSANIRRSMSLDYAAVRESASTPPEQAQQRLSVTSLRAGTIAQVRRRPPIVVRRYVVGTSALLRTADPKKRPSASNAAIKTKSFPPGCTATTCTRTVSYGEPGSPSRRQQERRCSLVLKTVRSSNDIRIRFEKTRRLRIAEEVKISATLLVVIVIFAVSWAPISLVNCIETFRLSNIAPAIDRLAVCVIFFQSAVNPIVYGVMNRNFRGGFDAILRCFAGRKAQRKNPEDNAAVDVRHSS